MSLRFCLFVIVVTALLLSAWIGITSAQVISNDPAVWMEQLCSAQPTHNTRDSYDDVTQDDPPHNPLKSLHLERPGHDYIIGGSSVDIIEGGPGDGCYVGNDDTDSITLVSQKTDTKYVIDDDEKKDEIKCVGKPLRLIIDISEAVRRLRPDVIDCPIPILVNPSN